MKDKKKKINAGRRSNRTPAGYVPKKHFRGVPAGVLPLHRQGLIKFLNERMGAAGYNMLQLTEKLGYSGRSAMSMVMSGKRAFPIERIDDLADILELKAGDRERLRELAIHAASSLDAFELFLKAHHRPSAAPAATPPTSSNAGTTPKPAKRVLFRG